MVNVLIRHKVENYEKWKSIFDAFEEHRASSGELAYQIFQPVDDPNNLFLLFDWESVESAQAFLSSEELKQAMQNAGVIQPVEITIAQKATEGVLS